MSTIHARALYGYEVLAVRGRSRARASYGYAIESVEGRNRAKLVTGYTVEAVEGRSRTKLAAGYAIEAVEGRRRTKLLLGYGVVAVEHILPFTYSRLNFGYIVTAVEPAKPVNSRALYGYQVSQVSGKQYTRLASGYTIETVEGRSRAKTLLGYAIDAVEGRSRTYNILGYSVTAVEPAPTVAYGGLLATVNVDAAIPGSNPITISFPGVTQIRRQAVVQLYADKIILSFGGSVLQWNGFPGNGSGRWVLYFAENMFTVTHNGVFGVLPLQNIDYDHSEHHVTVSSVVPGTIELAEMPDLFGAIYIETDNTVSGGLAMMLRDRPVITALRDAGAGIGIFVRRNLEQITDLSIMDAQQISFRPGKTLPTRGIVLGNDIIAFDTGGQAFGSAIVRVGADALLGRYGRVALQRAYAPRTSYRVTRFIGSGLRVKFGPTIHQGAQEDIVDTNTQLVLNTTLRVEDGNVNATLEAIDDG